MVTVTLACMMSRRAGAGWVLLKDEGPSHIQQMVQRQAIEVLRESGEDALINYFKTMPNKEDYKFALEDDDIARVWEEHTEGRARTARGVEEGLKESGIDVTTGDEEEVIDPMDIGSQGHDEEEKEEVGVLPPTKFANTARKRTVVNPHTNELEEVSRGSMFGRTGVVFGGGEGAHASSRYQSPSRRLRGPSVSLSESDHSTAEREAQHSMSATLAQLDAEKAAGDGAFGPSKMEPIPKGHVKVVMHRPAPSGKNIHEVPLPAETRFIPQDAYGTAHPGLAGKKGYTGVFEPREGKIVTDPNEIAQTAVMGGFPQVETGHRECPECRTGTRAGLKLPKYGQHFGKREHMIGDTTKAWYNIRLPQGQMTKNDMFGNEHPDPDDPAQHTEGGFFHIDNHKSWEESGSKKHHRLNKPMSREDVEMCLHYLGIHPDSADVLGERYPHWGIEEFPAAPDHGGFYADENHGLFPFNLNERLGILSPGIDWFHPTTGAKEKSKKRDNPYHLGLKWKPQYNDEKQYKVDEFGEFVTEPVLGKNGRPIRETIQVLDPETNKVEIKEKTDEDGNPVFRTRKVQEKTGVSTRNLEQGGLGTDAEPDIGLHLKFMRDVLLHEKEARERKANWMEFGGSINEPDLGEKLADGLRVGKTPCSLCAGHGTIQGGELLNYLAGSEAHPRYSSLTGMVNENEDGEVLGNYAYVNENHSDYATDAPLINDELMQNSRPFNQAGWDEDSDPLIQVRDNESDEYVCVRCTGRGVCATCPSTENGIGGTGNIPVGDPAMTSDERAEFYRNHGLFAHAHSLASTESQDPRFLQPWTDPLTGEGMPSYFRTEPGEGPQGEKQWEPRGEYVKTQAERDRVLQYQVAAERARRRVNRKPWGGFGYSRQTIPPFRTEIPDDLKTMREEIREEEAVRGSRQERQRANLAAGDWGGFEPGSTFGGPQPSAQLPPQPSAQLPPQPSAQLPPAPAPKTDERGISLAHHEDYGWPTATPWEIDSESAERMFNIEYPKVMGAGLPGSKTHDTEKVPLYERDPETNEIIRDSEGLAFPKQDKDGKIATKTIETPRDDYVGKFLRDPDAVMRAGFGHGVSYHDPDGLEAHYNNKINELVEEAAKKLPEGSKSEREQYVSNKMRFLYKREQEIKNRWDDADFKHDAFKYPNKVWEARHENYVHSAMRKYPELYAGWKESIKTSKDDDAHLYPGNTEHGERALFNAIRKLHPDWIPQAGSHNLAPEDLVVKSRARSPIDSAFFILKTYSRSVPRRNWAGGNGTTTASVSVVSQKQPPAPVSTFL